MAKKKDKKKQTFSDWRWNNFPQLPGRGASEAFMSGAKTRMRNEVGNPYSRSDCVNAFYNGFDAMDKTLKSGTIIICDCCGQEVKG